MKNTLKTNLNNALLILATVSLMAFLVACSPDEVEPTKTVDRSKLTDKWWYYNGSKFLYFGSDGSYNEGSGTWDWFPTGDSLEIKGQTVAAGKWYFNYITDSEMAMGSVKGSYAVYTTSP